MKKSIREIQLIHLSLTIGALAGYFVLGETGLEIFNFSKINQASIIFIFIPFIAAALGRFIFNIKLKGISTSKSVKENIEVYTSALIIRLALLEGAFFMLLILSPELGILNFLIIAYFIYIRPTESKIKNAISYSE